MHSPTAQSRWVLLKELYHAEVGPQSACPPRPQMVKIDSTGLGCLHLTLLLCIVGYVLVFPLLYETKYMAFAVRR